SDAAVATADPVSEVLSAPRAVPRPRRRILVTGAGGMLGSDLVPVLAGAGHDVFARPRSDLDITKEKDVALAFREIRPHVVVNCASFTRVDDCESDPRALEVNALGVHRLAEHSLRHAAQLVQISTDFVFDGEKREPYCEEDATNPLSAYGRGKRQGEEAALRVPSGLVVRSSWLFGPAGWNFIEAILKQVEAGRRKLTVVNDQTGRPTATSDLSEAILALIEAGAVGIYHFANRGEVTWFDFAREILVLSERGDVEVEPIGSETLGRPARRPPYSVLDISRYERVTGRPVRHHREALVEYLARRALPEA
ncbi:MAG TPA: dTDP-4-dehydrorhamnose reductase, partial [Thermoanaerobaculia bacterium]|nr:dTDP-4-dehydrorhamnose reductase [Thermoanaerobaculia bacterium]